MLPFKRPKKQAEPRENTPSRPVESTENVAYLADQITPDPSGLATPPKTQSLDFMELSPLVDYF